MLLLLVLTLLIYCTLFAFSLTTLLALLLSFLLADKNCFAFYCVAFSTSCSFDGINTLSELILPELMTFYIVSELILLLSVAFLATCSLPLSCLTIPTEDDNEDDGDEVFLVA